jgi:hypothetical protein
MALTAPLEESVVPWQKREVAVPKRTSFPSMLPPACNALGAIDAEDRREGFRASAAKTATLTA